MRKTFNALDISRKVIASRVHEGDICIDATAGRGNDTAYLCGLAGESGKIIAFDIQQEAIDSTAKLLEEKGFQAVRSLSSAATYRWTAMRRRAQFPASPSTLAGSPAATTPYTL